MAEKTAAKYRGAIASGYEAQRAGAEKWQAEDRVLRDMLSGFPAGTMVLDVPFGTGRFFPFYMERGFAVRGFDISQDMLKQARPKLEPFLGQERDVMVGEGDIFDLPLPDRSVDVAVAVRIMNLIGADDMVRALRELQRVARSRVIFNLRVWHEATKYRRPQRLETVSAALRPGWRIAESREIHAHDFRMFALEMV